MSDAADLGTPPKNGGTLPRIPKELEQTALHNSLVHNWLVQGGPLPDLINHLVEALQRSQVRILELENICPRRYRLPSGKEMIWRCPEDLVPVQNLNRRQTQIEETE